MAALSLSLLITLLSSTLHLRFALSELETIKHPSNGGHLGFLVIGDWGRRGGFNQSEVAFQMGKVGEEMAVDFVVSTGDNFYDDGLTGEHDPAFEESFTKVYAAESLQKQWYTVLGNHDYRGDAEAQLSPFLRKIDPRWTCIRSFIVDAEIAEIFFVDTTPFVDMYVNDTDHTYDWRGIPSRNTYIRNLLKDLDSALQRSTAKWRIVVGHHAIRSVGHHGDTVELVDQLLPILRSNSVDFYINGHDHCLEHISDDYSPVQFLTSGAGSKAWRGDTEGLNRNDVKFFYDGQGFMSMQVNHWEARIAFYDVDGQILHTWLTSKQHYMAS